MLNDDARALLKEVKDGFLRIEYPSDEDGKAFARLLRLAEDKLAEQLAVEIMELTQDPLQLP